MQRLCRRVMRCPRCPELVKSRTAPVFGEGKLAAKAFLVGEAPGRREDDLGRPFVATAGQFLDELLLEAGIARNQVFLTNVIKCHPPGNRLPHRREVLNCLPYLQEQILLVRPRVLCTLGGVAARALVGTNEPLERLRRRRSQYEGIPVICSYHPAYVRRMPPAVRARAVADLRRMRDQLSTAAAWGR